MLPDELLLRTLTDRADAAERNVVRAWREGSAANERHYQDLAELLELARRVEHAAEIGPPPLAASIQAQAAAFEKTDPPSVRSGARSA